MQPYDLFKGGTRAPEMLGIPRDICIMIFAFAAALAMIVWKPLFLLSVIVYWRCLNVYRKDKDGFRIYKLWLTTTWLHAFLKGEDAEYLNADHSPEEYKR